MRHVGTGARVDNLVGVAAGDGVGSGVAAGVGFGVAAGDGVDIGVGSSGAAGDGEGVGLAAGGAGTVAGGVGVDDAEVDGKGDGSPATTGAGVGATPQAPEDTTSAAARVKVTRRVGGQRMGRSFGPCFSRVTPGPVSGSRAPAVGYPTRQAVETLRAPAHGTLPSTTVGDARDATIGRVRADRDQSPE